MAVEDINKRVRAMSEKQVEKGQEMQEVQKSQSELLNINNERRNNLNTARVESAMEAENNQNLAQAATLMAAGVGGGMAVSQQVQGFNPQTQALLSKYGVGKPQQNTVTSRNSQVTPQKVTINNTTTTNTTNNVQVSQPNIPVSQPQIALKQPINQGESKIKAWLNGVFARQNERAALREKEYQKRESTLTRSANKMMRRMEEVGKTFAERLDPRRIGNVFGDQIKTLMFLFGFGMLSKNWDKVLGFVSKAEEFYNWVRGDESKSFFSGLENKVINFLGGDPNDPKQKKEGILGALRELFIGKDGSFLSLLEKKFEMWTKERADAIKMIKFPSLDLGDISGSIKALGIYIGDMLSCLMSGTEGARKSITHEIEHEGRVKSFNNDADWVNKDVARFDEGAKHISDTSLGAATIVQGSKKQNFLDYRDVDSEGKLINNTDATVKQASSISSMINDTVTDTVHTSGVITGLKQLEDSAKKHGNVTVDSDLIWSLHDLGINIGDIPKAEYKFIKVPKTEEDFAAEEAGGFTKGFIKAYGERHAIEYAKKSLGLDDSLAVDFVDAIKTGDIVQNPTWQGLMGGLKEKFNRATADNYTLKMVPWSEGGDGVGAETIYSEKKRGWEKAKSGVNPDKFNKDEAGKKFTFYQLSPEHFEKIKFELHKKLGLPDEESFEFSAANRNSVSKLEDLLREVKVKKMQSAAGREDYGSSEYLRLKNITSAKLTSDVDLEKLNRLDKIDQDTEKRQKEWNETYELSRVKKVKNNTVELANDIYNQGKKAIRSFIGSFTPTRKLLSDSKELSKAELESRITKSINKLVKKFDLTPEQASGIVGNWMQESGMKTTAFNPEGGGEGAVGLAQWRGARIRKFEGKAKNGEGNNYTGPGAGTSLYDATFDQQLDYAIWELENSHKSAIKKLKEASDSTEAADIGLGYYEFSAGLNKALEQLGNHAMLENRRNYAYTALQVYNESSEAKNNTIPDEVPGTNESEVLLANAKSSTPNPTISTIPTKSKVIIGKDGYEYSVAPDYEESIIEPTYSTPITSAKPVYADTNFNNSPEKVTPKVTTKTSDTDLLATVDNISETLGQQTVAIQNLAIGVTALADVAVNTGNTTINNKRVGISYSFYFIISTGLYR